MNRLKHYASLWIGYQKMGIIAMTQYPVDTVIMLVSMIAREAAGFIGVLAIANVAGGIGGWGLYDICLLFAMCAVIEAIGQAFFDNVWGINYLVREGMMDRMLIRPAPVFFQLLGDVCHYQAVLSMAVYVGVLVFAMNGLGIGLSVGVILFLAEFMICGTIINTGIYTIFNSLNFWVVQGEDIAVLVQTCREFVKYPVGAFPGLIKLVFTYVLPFGFVGYYPAAYLTGKTGTWVLWGLPLCAALVSLVASLMWKAGAGTYNSTGT